MTKKQEITEKLSKCYPDQIRKFKQIYCFDKLNSDISIDEIVSCIKNKDYNHCLFLLNNTLKKNAEPKKEKVKKDIPRIKVDEVWEYAIEKGREISRELRNEPAERGIIGGVLEDEFEFNKKKYEISITAFWEKSNWFEISVSGVNYKRSGDGEF